MAKTEKREGNHDAAGADDRPEGEGRNDEKS